MQQENTIKMIKNVFKGLGAGKTDEALLRASKAALAVNYLAEDFQAGFGIH